MLGILNICPDNGCISIPKDLKLVNISLFLQEMWLYSFEQICTLFDNINKTRWHYTFTELFKPYTNVGPTPALPTKERAGDTQLLVFGSL